MIRIEYVEDANVYYVFFSDYIAWMSHKTNGRLISLIDGFLLPHVFYNHEGPLA